MFQRFIYFALFSVATLAIKASDNEYLRDSIPQRWSYLPENVMEIPSADEAWWTTLHDATLDSLITLGLERNYDAAMALRRSEIARAAVGQARAAWYPTIGMSAGWTREQSSGRTTGTVVPSEAVSYFNAGLTASWEIDIFGKIASGVKAKKAAYQATRAEYAGAMLSISAQIASTYVELRKYQALLVITREHAIAQDKIVKMARARFEATLASKLDVEQALITYYSTTAQIPMLENSLNTTLNALAVLLCDETPEFRQRMMQPAELPVCNTLMGIGVPADMLRRRPDIAQAEMEIASYAAQLGIAKKDFLPTLTIQGSIGTQSHDIDHLFGSHSLTYSVMPTLSWTLFDGMSRKYALSAAKESLQLGIENYNLTVLNAVQEADNAISTYTHTLQYAERLQLMVDASEEALKLAVTRYRDGLSPMSDVVNAQLNALSSASELVTTQASSLEALVSIYEAVGGKYDM